jgi:hypothetical protein
LETPVSCLGIFPSPEIACGRRLWLRGKNGVAIIGAVNSTNKMSIAQTAASCDRIGEALIKGLALPGAPLSSD